MYIISFRQCESPPNATQLTYQTAIFYGELWGVPAFFLTVTLNPANDLQKTKEVVTNLLSMIEDQFLTLLEERSVVRF